MAMHRAIGAYRCGVVFIRVVDDGVHVSVYTTALRRFLFGATAENDNFMAKMEKCCFLFAKNDYLIEFTSIFSLK